MVGLLGDSDCPQQHESKKYSITTKAIKLVLVSVRLEIILFYTSRFEPSSSLHIKGKGWTIVGPQIIGVVNSSESKSVAAARQGSKRKMSKISHP